MCTSVCVCVCVYVSVCACLCVSLVFSVSFLAPFSSLFSSSDTVGSTQSSSPATNSTLPAKTALWECVWLCLLFPSLRLFTSPLSPPPPPKENLPWLFLKLARPSPRCVHTGAEAYQNSAPQQPRDTLHVHTRLVVSTASLAQGFHSSAVITLSLCFTAVGLSPF